MKCWLRNVIALSLLFGSIWVVGQTSEAGSLKESEIVVKTKNLSLRFVVGADRRLYQSAVGLPLNGRTPMRVEEAYPQSGDGYVFEPALEVVHADGNTSTRLLFAGITRTNEASGREMTRIGLRDPEYPFETTLCFRTDFDRDVLEQWTEVLHAEEGTVLLRSVASGALLLPPDSVHLTHFYGDWADEMNPFTELLTPGTKVLDSKLGVRAHQFQLPSFVISFDGPAVESSGRVLAGSLAWSGNFRFAFDHFGPRLRVLAGTNPFASEYRLAKGQIFATPAILWVWNDSGLGGMTRKLHSWARDFGYRDGYRPREVLLNNWEATGFDFDFNRIASLFEPAKRIGTELFLLDDGWFGNQHPRLNDGAGLGDWEPNRKRFPNGLAPLAESATGNGLRFGIWIEPEMVNPKSDLFIQHPDWIIAQPKRSLELQRNQLVLDLTRAEVQDFEWKTIEQILQTPGISYAKWDCNRYLTQPGSFSLGSARQSHLWIDYTRALYALMEKTARSFPDTELMLCSGGGGRVDYGALPYFHEFWPSDNTDPVKRILMQWDYSYFFPVMTISSHVTHSGKRPMHFACAVAMSARFGMDLDLAKLTPDEMEICNRAIKTYKQIREVTHLGDLYRLQNPHTTERGGLNFVSKNQTRAVVFVFQLRDGNPTPISPRGLNPERKYTVRELNPAAGRKHMSAEGQTFTGQELMLYGFVPSCRRALEASIIELLQE